MTERLNVLCGLLAPCNSFADVGCDHGYCTEFMLKNKLCRHATITDVSEESLKKAQTLLSGYIAAGECDFLCTDGLQGVDKNVDEVLIAGMGGMETVKILKEGFIPRRFVLQPMREAEKVRLLLIESGCTVERDFTFYANGNYYSAIVGTLGGKGQTYTKAQIMYGRENILEKGKDFCAYLQGRIQKQESILSKPLTTVDRERALRKINYLQGVLKGEIE